MQAARAYRRSLPFQAKKLDGGAPAGRSRPPSATNEPVSFDIDATVDDLPVVATIDSGCTGILVSQDVIKKINNVLWHGSVRHNLAAEGAEGGWSRDPCPLN